MTPNLMRPLLASFPSCAATKHGSVKHKSRANTKKNLIARMRITVVNGLACLKLL